MSQLRIMDFNGVLVCVSNALSNSDLFKVLNEISGENNYLSFRAYSICKTS